MKIKILSRGFFSLVCTLSLSIVACAGGPRTGNRQLDETTNDDEIVDEVEAIETAEPKSIPNINVYVENSGSMDGYVGSTSESDFRNTVYNYLTDIKMSGVAEAMNLYFINSKKIHITSSVEDFVKKLDPQQFRISGGNRRMTDIADIIKDVYPKNGEISILISDYIVSPGKGKNASEYLVNQQIGLKTSIYETADMNNTCVLIYRMIGQFNGLYYNEVDAHMRYTGKRPYYIWIMGNKHYVKKIREKLEPKMKVKPDKICIVSNGSSSVKYNIVPGSGLFQISHSDNFTIEKLKAKTKTPEGNKAVIKLKIDFSNMLQDASYLTNPANYEVSKPSYQVDNIKKQDDGQYILTLSSSIVSRGMIKIKLKNKLPQWVVDCSDNVGGFPDPEAPLQKTYGFSYLVNGVYDAYTFQNGDLAEFTINIQ